MGFLASDAFRSARDAWYRARVASAARREREGLTVRAAVDVRRVQARWAPRVAVSMARSSAHHVADPRLADRMRQLVADVAPAITESMDAALASTAFAAWRAWPVASGYSRSSIDIEYRAGGSIFVGAVVVNAPYWRFIPVRGGAAWRILLQSRGRPTATRIIDDAADRLRRAR